MSVVLVDHTESWAILLLGVALVVLGSGLIMLKKAPSLYRFGMVGTGICLLFIGYEGFKTRLILESEKIVYEGGVFGTVRWTRIFGQLGAELSYCGHGLGLGIS